LTIAYALTKLARGGGNVSGVFVHTERGGRGLIQYNIYASISEVVDVTLGVARLEFGQIPLAGLTFVRFGDGPFGRPRHTSRVVAVVLARKHTWLIY